MKALALILFVMLIGCATIKPMPDQDIVVLAPSGPVKITRGWLDNPDNFFTMPEWEAMMQEQIEMQQRLLEEYMKGAPNPEA